MSRRMVLVTVLLVLSGSLAQGTLLNTTTVDPLHVDYSKSWPDGNPGSIYWSEKSPLPVNLCDLSSIFTPTADLNDPEWPQYGVQRVYSNDFMFGYQTAPSYQFSQVEVCMATNGEIDASQIRFSYANGNDTYTDMAATEVVDLGWMNGGWMGAILCYDLDAIKPDRIRITMQGGPGIHRWSVL